MSYDARNGASPRRRLAADRYFPVLPELEAIMPEQSEREFHLTRQQACQAMARQASSDPARIAHEGLARQHARRAEQMSRKIVRK